MPASRWDRGSPQNYKSFSDYREQVLRRRWMLWWVNSLAFSPMKVCVLLRLCPQSFRSFQPRSGKLASHTTLSSTFSLAILIYIVLVISRMAKLQVAAGNPCYFVWSSNDSYHSTGENAGFGGQILYPAEVSPVLKTCPLQAPPPENLQAFPNSSP